MKAIILVCLGLLLPLSAISEELTGPEIIRKVSDLMNQESAVGVMKMTITTTSGQKREFTYDSYSADSGKSNVVIYTDPVRVKGQATLLLNNADDIWGYYPRTDRVRKLATHAKKQKMQGSDFTYEDMGGGNSFLTEFDTKKIGEDKMQDHDCYIIELVNNGTGSSKYAKIKMYVIKENFVPVVIDYYDKDDPDVAEKRLVQSDIKDIQGVATPMEMTMHNNLDDSETYMEIVKIEYNVKIDRSRFESRSFYK